MQEITSFLDVIRTTEENVDFLERYLFGFRNEKPDESCKKDVDGKEKEECFAMNGVSQFSPEFGVWGDSQAAFRKEGGEELLKNAVSDVLHL